MTTRNRNLENKWTSDEDVILTEAVAACGPKICWGKVAAKLEGRTNKSCRKRWIHSLDPTLRKGRWTPAEDALLLMAIRKHGRHWYRVAEIMPGRTDDQCAKRWREKLDPSIRRDPWAKTEDDQLLSLLETHGKRWNIISGNLKGRPAVHCRNRWVSLVRAGRATDGGSTIPALTPAPGAVTPEGSKATDEVLDTEDCVQPDDLSPGITPNFDLSCLSDRSFLECSPSPSTRSSSSAFDPMFSGWEPATQKSSPLSGLMDDQLMKNVNETPTYEKSLDIDFGLFNPHSFLASDQENQITALNSFPAIAKVSTSNSAQNEFLSSFNPQIPKTQSSEVVSNQDASSFTWEQHLAALNGSQQLLGAPSSFQRSMAADSPMQGHPTTIPLAKSPHTRSLSTEDIFRMTCPLPLCQFQSEKLTNIWRHITWEHVGSKTARTSAMEELVEMVVMGSGSND